MLKIMAALAITTAYINIVSKSSYEIILSYMCAVVECSGVAL